jgi:PIN domain nuclease of toxin-antitoxin system
VRFLLDTHVWLWLQVEPRRVAAKVRQRLANPAHDLLLSVASLWEMAIKYRLGKLPLPEPPSVFVPGRLARQGVVTLDVRSAHVLRTADLPLHHGDPFDRLLIAQAQIEGLTVVTADAKLGRYEVALLRV